MRLAPRILPGPCAATAAIKPELISDNHGVFDCHTPVDEIQDYTTFSKKGLECR